MQRGPEPTEQPAAERPVFDSDAGATSDAVPQKSPAFAERREDAIGDVKESFTLLGVGDGRQIAA